MGLYCHSLKECLLFSLWLEKAWALMGFSCNILGTLMEFMAMTAMLYHFLFLGFESLPWYWELFHQLRLLCFSSNVVWCLPASLFHSSAAICMVTLMVFIYLLNYPTPISLCGSLFPHTLLAFLSFWILHELEFLAISFMGFSDFIFSLLHAVSSTCKFWLFLDFQSVSFFFCLFFFPHLY